VLTKEGTDIDRGVAKAMKELMELFKPPLSKK
jgi:hypothetical protein